MKTLCSFIFLAALAFGAQAQIAEGTWLLGTGLSFYANGEESSSGSNGFTTTSTSDNLGLGLNVTLGKYVKENMAVGIIPNVNFQTVNNLQREIEDNALRIDESNTSTVSTGLSGFLRKNHLIKGKFMFIQQVQAGGGFSQDTRTETESSGIVDPEEILVSEETKTTSSRIFTNASYRVGLTYFVHEKIALESTLSLLTLRYNQSTGGDSQDRWGFDVSTDFITSIDNLTNIGIAAFFYL